jgi:hypothetical protein
MIGSCESGLALDVLNCNVPECESLRLANQLKRWISLRLFSVAVEPV